jgi:hypothetical protein
MQMVDQAKRLVEYLNDINTQLKEIGESINHNFKVIDAKIDLLENLMKKSVKIDVSYEQNN